MTMKVLEDDKPKEEIWETVFDSLADKKESPKESAKETINHPSHYNSGKIEVIDYIEDQKLGFHLGNAVKYICRAEHKGKKIEDLKKAIWHLEREIKKTN